MSQHGCPERLSNRSKGFQEDGPSQPTMEVLVETLTGTAFEMTVSPSDTIFAIKSKIFRVEGIPVSQQHLLYNLKELEDSSSLHEHAISDGARLRLVLGMCGGPITTRRLPPPPNAEPWRDIERILDSNREESEWGSNGCKVTVLVFREGERVNMLRVRENRDGSYSPLDHNKYSSSLTHLVEQEPEEGGAGALHDNAVTMGKMLDLRRRMESLSVRRRCPRSDDKPEIQKTRSEETLSVPSLLDEPSVEPFKSKTYTSYSEAEDSFAPLYDGNYTRYDYDCSFADRYSLLPPIGTRTDSEPSVQDAGDSERLSTTLAGSILVKGREDEAAILEECLDTALPECRIRQDSTQLAAKNLAPIQAAEYGPLVWRAAGFGSAGGLAGGLAPLAPRAAHHSASALHVRPPRRHAPLSSSTSTSGLDHLTRTRILPALSRHRNREHLHLSDEGLDLSGAGPGAGPGGGGPGGAGPSGGGRPHNPEVGSERRQRRIERIAEMDARLALPDKLDDRVDTKPVKEPLQAVERRGRVRCQLCRRRLSIATAHTCRCGGRYCAPHRYQEVHGCAYDYKAAPAAPAPARARLPDI